jgi:hypothetical protein
VKKRTAFALIVMPLLLGGWFDDPPSWARPDGGPIDPDVFQHERSVCATRLYGSRGLMDGELQQVHAAIWVRAHTPRHPSGDRTN